jgi:WD40 repeat protein
VFKEHVAVSDLGSHCGHQGQIRLFNSDTGAVDFTLNPFQVQHSILFGSLHIQNPCFYTVSGDYMYACNGPVINKYHISQKKQASLCFEGHTDSILSLVVGGSFLFTSSRDNTIKKWDIYTGANLATISGHFNLVNCLQVSDNFLYSGSSDCIIKKWTFDLELSK